MNKIRPELKLISEWIKPGSRVLDLACGDGSLLKYLHDNKQVSGYGIEIDPDHIASCIAKGINVIQTNLDRGLADFDADSFDYIIMTQSLQAMHYPLKLIQEMLRVGQEGIISFPNFGHWRSRFSFMLKGRMPVTRSLPYDWYDTPNIHLCSLKDFAVLCQKQNIRILQRSAANVKYQTKLTTRLFPNLLSEIAIYRFKYN